MTISDETEAAEPSTRTRLARLLDEVRPWDEQEHRHLDEAKRWVAGTKPVYRARKPDVPPMHLVVYFVVSDEHRGELLLVAHRKAGLWLPAGGHVEPEEDPWDAVARECREELRIEAVPTRDGDRDPFFVTITRTRGEGTHIDVCLWFVLRGTTEEVTSFDEGEFDAIRWLSPLRVLAEPQDTLDPHMHRFTRKLLAATAPDRSATAATPTRGTATSVPAHHAASPAAGHTARPERFGDHGRQDAVPGPPLVDPADCPPGGGK